MILDGGTGIRRLGRRPDLRGPVTILVTHAHMDHIGGIPFFGPALCNGRPLKIFGPPGLKKALANLFPFSVLTSQKRIVELSAGPVKGAPFRAECLFVNHPGGALAYRLSIPKGPSLVYISDHEPRDRFRHNLRAPSDTELIRWMNRPDLLILDSQYFDGEYKKRRGWGHSPLSYSVRLALQSGAKQLVLFHHDPSHSDARLERKLKRARTLIAAAGTKLPCRLAREGQTLLLKR